MKNNNFRPWVGPKYHTEGFQGKKILVLGESHYCEKALAEGGRCHPLCKLENMNEECYSRTEDAVRESVFDYTGEPYQRTFVCFDRAVVGKELSQAEREDFWNRVVFYNYIQFSQTGPRIAPRAEHWDWSEKAFRELLEEYMPDYIIVWGVRLFERLPDWGSIHSKLSISETDSTDVRTYNIQGKDIPALKVHHPSSSTGKAWKYWHQYYVRFLGLTE